MFGGNGFDSVGTEAQMNDLWKYSAGQWTWVAGSSVAKQHGTYGTPGVASANNIPGARNSGAVWKDSSGDIWLFGGSGYDASSTFVGLLNDLWKYSGGQWTWMSGSSVQGQKGIYGTKGSAAAANVPGGRIYPYSWADSSGNLWLFGGVGYDANGNDLILNDLWKYSSGQWTWVGGSNIGNQGGVYGTKGVASANNIPGAREMGIAWTDASGNAWLFGGSGYYSPSGAGNLNDLWKFSGGQWTWVSGSNVANQNSTYGTQGVLFPGNTPGCRFDLNGWVDANGNLWLFGGYGQVPGAMGNLNDLWMYMP
jgi:N-acetylneuraminic acid mutarotase